MNGSLAQRSPSDVLAEVQRRQVSGVLRFQSDATTRQLFIDAGHMIRFAVSTLTSESITALFRDKGGVTDAHVKQATAGKQKDELLGTTLVRLGVLSKDTLTELTREHIHRVTLGALAMRQGAFEFQAGALPFREQLDGGLSSAEILLEWARVFPDIDWIRRRFGPADARVQMSGRPPEGYQKVPLNPAEGYIMSRVDGRASAGEICMVSPMGEDVTLRALFSLALAGILEMPEGSAEIPPPAGPPAAATPRPAAVTAARTPTNGGAQSAASATHAAPRAPAPPRAAGPTGAVKPASPGAPARPGVRSAAHAPPTSPRRVTSITERVRPSTTPDLEVEMLQRFERLRAQDLYEVLGIAPAATRTEIRHAYYALAKRFHPDKFTREEMKTKAEKVFAHITEAYSTLTGEESRRRYDEDQAIRKSGHAQEKKSDGGEVARMNFKHGKEMFDKGRFGEAISFLQNACDQEPSKAEHFHYLAMAQSKNPRWKKDAEENFLRAIERDPTNAEIYSQLGSLYARGGLHSKARDMFTKALQWDPSNAEAVEGLAQEAGGKKGILGLFNRK